MSPRLLAALDDMADLLDRLWQHHQDEERLDEQTHQLYLLSKYRLVPSSAVH